MNPYERIFSDWYEERSIETSNWNFDFENAAKEGFFAGIAVSYAPLQEILDSAASALNITVQSHNELFYATITAPTGVTTIDGQTRQEAIYKAIKLLSSDE